MSAEAQAEQLARTVVSIADPALRVSYMRHALQTLAPQEVADLFMVAMASAEARTAHHRELLQTLSLALADESCDELRSQTRAVLDARSEPALATALRHDPGVRDDDEAQRIPDFGTGRTLTLGERKALARRQNRDLLARVLRDPHPDVIRILLGNPGLTERDVVTLCARRPVMGEVLREVFRQHRWIVRYRVKRTLVLNPYTPLDVALQLVPLLQSQDLRAVLQAGELRADLREACRRMLGRTHSVTVH
jgi:hypothetical protein